MPTILTIFTFIAGIILVIDAIFRNSYRMYAIIAIAAIVMSGLYLKNPTLQLGVKALIMAVYFIQFRKKAS